MSPGKGSPGSSDEPNTAPTDGPDAILRVLVDDVRDFKDGREAVVLRTSADAVAYVRAWPTGGSTSCGSTTT